MKYPQYTLQILAFAVCVFLFTSCGTTETTIENTWTARSKGIANKIYTGAWEYYGMERGDGVVIRLYRRDFIVGSYDGQSYYEITIALPASATVGDSFVLTSIPDGRQFRRVDTSLQLAEMRSREIVAMRFGNPRMSWMKSPERASVRIVSIKKQKAVIHVVLKATLEPNFVFDVNQKFVVPISEYTRENKPHHPTARSRSVDMFSHNFNLNPVRDFRPRS